jgi:TetR/AcrR family transcriptional regulator, transcriptional repressor for nem operon
MPRPIAHSREALVEKAMLHFWHHGYGATSMDDLVQATKVSRHGLYSQFGGKEELFAACLDAYSAQIVTPAFAQVEQLGATLETVADYFEFQITRCETLALPPSGCLMANTMTELAARRGEAFARVLKHNARLALGFRNALCNSFPQLSGVRFATALDDLAFMMVTFTSGLWSSSRTAPDPARLRAAVRQFLSLIERSYNYE